MTNLKQALPHANSSIFTCNFQTLNLCSSEHSKLCFGHPKYFRSSNVTDNTRQEVANAIRKIEPAIDVEVEYVELPDKPDNQ